MTREQAIAAVIAKLPRPYATSEGDSPFVSAVMTTLETVGLIKFDKDERDEGRRFVKHMAAGWLDYANNHSGAGDVLARVIIDDIESAKLKIVRD